MKKAHGKSKRQNKGPVLGEPLYEAAARLLIVWLPEQGYYKVLFGVHSLIITWRVVHHFFP